MGIAVLRILLSMVGFFFIFMAVDYGRTKENKIKLFTKQGLIVLGMVLLGVILNDIEDGIGVE